MRPASSVGLIGRAFAGGGGFSARGVGVQRRVGKPPSPGGGRGGADDLFEGVRSFTPETTIAAAVREGGERGACVGCFVNA